MIQSSPDADDLRVLLAIPVYNEADHVHSVLTEVRKRVSDVLVIDDGSTDATSSRMALPPPSQPRLAE